MANGKGKELLLTVVLSLNNKLDLHCIFTINQMRCKYLYRSILYCIYDISVIALYIFTTVLISHTTYLLTHLHQFD